MRPHARTAPHASAARARKLKNSHDVVVAAYVLLERQELAPGGRAAAIDVFAGGNDDVVPVERRVRLLVSYRSLRISACRDKGRKENMASSDTQGAGLNQRVGTVNLSQSPSLAGAEGVRGVQFPG